MSQGVAAMPLRQLNPFEQILTEDDTPVDNLFSAKQQRLLVNALYGSWTPPHKEGRPNKARIFLADVNVGIFYAVSRPPLVPDFFLSLDVKPHDDWYAQQHRSYFVWEFGKVPEVVIEIVSNRKGTELTDKLAQYAQMGINYYVVYDPEKTLSKEALRVYEIGSGKRYVLRSNHQLPELSLSLKLWKGTFEGKSDMWLRWCDAKGKLVHTGEERARTAENEVERLRAELAQLKQKPSRK
jgi:Uma2 family endonuclease